MQSAGRHLPSKDQWVEDVLNFCTEYSWIFNTRITDLFVMPPWTTESKDWVAELQMLDLGAVRDILLPTACTEPSSLPNNCDRSSLINFAARCVFLTSRYDAVFEDKQTLPQQLKKGMNVKKVHETESLAPAISSLYKEHGCNMITDIGCGLGYLTHTLHSFYNLPVIGLELSGQNCHGADMLSNTSYPVIKQKIDSSLECTEQLKRIITEQNQIDPLTDIEARVCMIGLHCCADLTPSMLHQFIRLEEYHTLICMPCCYHRMASNSEGDFINFPLSRSVKSVYNNITSDRGVRLNSLAFRLACQQTPITWMNQTAEERYTHSNNVCYRAVLQHCIHKNGYKMVKKNKRIQTSGSKINNFIQYAENVIERCEFYFNRSDLTDSEIVVNKGELEQRLTMSFKECEHMFNLIQPYNTLQVCMQSVLESLVLRDRVFYLQEHGFTAQLVSVFNDEISPRNIAIISHK